MGKSGEEKMDESGKRSSFQSTSDKTVWLRLKLYRSKIATSEKRLNRPAITLRRIFLRDAQIRHAFGPDLEAKAMFCAATSTNGADGMTSVPTLLPILLRAPRRTPEMPLPSPLMPPLQKLSNRVVPHLFSAFQLPSQPGRESYCGAGLRSHETPPFSMSRRQTGEDGWSFPSHSSFSVSLFPPTFFATCMRRVDTSHIEEQRTESIEGGFP
ncbi:hypothetical protein CSHISOI_06775 [Colletotrichum shisoi]|uniref:Uncharacterized protein n=1 Tax=Colletotrichum shisoi TaxID=2078593 RepID=A0A5Q4BNV0_9PEZI|nr:hypothetical protein CSHISOI_06775 [Colletotrichum shisoi]